MEPSFQMLRLTVIKCGKIVLNLKRNETFAEKYLGNDYVYGIKEPVG